MNINKKNKRLSVQMMKALKRGEIKIINWNQKKKRERFLRPMKHWDLINRHLYYKVEGRIHH